MTIVTSLNSAVKQSPTGSDGFVLILVIWVLAGLSLMVAFMASQLDQLQSTAIESETFMQQQLDQRSLQSVVLYLAATRTHSYAGLRTQPYVPTTASAIDLIETDFFAADGLELKLDGRPYVTSSGLRLQLQDAGSLISLRSDGLNSLRALLESYNFGFARVDQLIAALQDYTDRDEVSLLNGAERSEYERRDLPPPTNRFLVSPWQLNNVLGWREVLSEHPELLNEITIYVADRENYNSMTRKAIEVLTPNDADEASRIIEQRRASSYKRLEQVNDVSGNLYSRDVFSITFVPSRYIRMTVSDPELRKATQIGITLTPDSNLSPWEIDYTVTRPYTADYNNDIGRLEPTASPTTLL